MTNKNRMIINTCFTQTLLFTLIGVSFLFIACNRNHKVEHNKTPQNSNQGGSTHEEQVLNDLLRWNTLRKSDSKKIKRILNHETMYFQIKRKNALKSENKNEQVHAYAAINTDSTLCFYLIDKSKDVLSNPNLLKDLKKYPLSLLTSIPNVSIKDTTILNDTQDSISITNANDRIDYWNDSIHRNTWISNTLKYYSSSDSILMKVNPMFSVFVIKSIDYIPLDQHFCTLALKPKTSSTKPKHVADLIVSNTKDNRGEVLYALDDMVRSIPPCNPSQHSSSCDISTFGVLQLIANNTPN